MGVCGLYVCMYVSVIVYVCVYVCMFMYVYVCLNEVTMCVCEGEGKEGERGAMEGVGAAWGRRNGGSGARWRGGRMGRKKPPQIP